jgi:hypothetical protein
MIIRLKSASLALVPGSGLPDTWHSEGCHSQWIQYGFQSVGALLHHAACRLGKLHGGSIRPLLPCSHRLFLLLFHCSVHVFIAPRFALPPRPLPTWLWSCSPTAVLQHPTTAAFPCNCLRARYGRSSREGFNGRLQCDNRPAI